MTEQPIITGIREDDRLRASFNVLALNVFGLSLERWYEAGCWDARYTPHSILVGDQMVANVSATVHQARLNGEDVVVVQIGTVMTHPDSRGRGLASRLMQHVVEQHRSTADLMLLYCDDDLEPFYERFGFRRMDERQFERPLTDREVGWLGDGTPARRIDPKDSGRREWLRDLVERRIPVSDRYGLRDGGALWMYHGLYRFADDLWWIEELDTLVIARPKDGILDLIDVVSLRPVGLADLLPHLPEWRVISVRFGFTPDRVDPNCPSAEWPDPDLTMARGRIDLLSTPFTRPVTGMA